MTNQNRRYSGASATRPVQAEIAKLSIMQGDRFATEYKALMDSVAGRMPEQSIRVVAEVKQWLGDPLGPVWGALAGAVEREVEFLRVTDPLRP